MLVHKTNANAFRFKLKKKLPRQILPKAFRMDAVVIRSTNWLKESGRKYAKRCVMCIRNISICMDAVEKY